MATIICRGVYFTYPGGSEPVFTDLDLILRRSARTALGGRNGRGKTTLLRLLAGMLQPDRGSIEGHSQVCLFEPQPAAGERTAWETAKDSAGPYRRWEAAMETALATSSDAALAEYADLQQRYAEADGYRVEARLAELLKELELPEQHWHRPLAQLSGGEATRAALAGLFASGQRYPLIDEPTNHLDRRGRARLADFLTRRAGFLLVSHDRTFVDQCTEQTLVLNQDDVQLNQGSFSDWRARHQRKLQAQAERNTQLRREAQRLNDAADARRAGAHAREAAKSGAVDKGFEGARAARQMKRALAAEQRARSAAQGRRDAMHNVEKHYPLRLAAHEHDPAPLEAHDLIVHRPAPLFAPLSFSLQPGDRLVLDGSNGSGKSSLLQLIAGEPLSYTGTFNRSERLSVSYLPQEPPWQRGWLGEHLRAAGLEEGPFRQALAALGMRGADAERPLETLSFGQRKKIALARSLLEPSSLLLWDEPLNYLDIDAREALETLISTAQPTMILIEHDAAFVDAVATATVTLVPQAPARS